VAGQVEQLAADVQGRQVDEVPHALRLRGPHGVQQPHQGALQHIVGVRPAPHVGEAAQHRAGQALQPVADAAQQGIGGRPLAGAVALEVGVQGSGVEGRVGRHGRTP
jgi:hypothetical protein